ncbi:uncharacterized protein PpBr36_09489 [Pyricularia pennisetigena]|uniref:uncharacterized protein n=1 Tax=Pyricularia pennisetigena TaxID=1578925 RepID=UPI0011504FCD|nr:uncharacterized protein PpBr36_09489 [Pyricularia pennisetigena]TLS22020.1 hypothetical protein PpBr36_09489 [Pyricularia pennisetigena]
MNLVHVSTPTYTVGINTCGGQNPLAGIYATDEYHIVAFQLVTVDGWLRAASDDGNPDLLRGITGAGLYSYIMRPTPQLSMTHMLVPDYMLQSYIRVAQPVFDYLEANNISSIIRFTPLRQHHYRHDRFDAMAIQAHPSGIDVTRFPRRRNIASPKRQGACRRRRSQGKLKDGEKGCWRARTDVWQHILDKQIQALLVLESDAGWDVNLRPIMGRLNGGFRELLENGQPGSGELCRVRRPGRPKHQLHLGSGRRAAQPEARRVSIQVHYLHDGVPGLAVRAARLLVRSSFDLNDPIDVMTEDGQLRTYVHQQRIVAQWEYISPASAIPAATATSTATGATWTAPRRVGTAPRCSWPRSSSGDVQFRAFALGRAWQNVLGE